jgi:PII-like signaling protein
MSQVLPLVIELIDDEEKVRSFLNEIEPMMEEGLTSMSDVEVITYKHK